MRRETVSSFTLRSGNLTIIDGGASASDATLESVKMEQGKVEGRLSRYDVMIVRYNFAPVNNHTSGFAVSFAFKTHST